MGKILISEQIALAEFPEGHKEIRAKFPNEEVEFYYNWCVAFGNHDNYVPKDKDDSLRHSFVNWGLSLDGKVGKKKHSVLIKQASVKEYKLFPKTVYDQMGSVYDKRKQEELTQTNRTSNLDSILKAVGKKGSSLIEPEPQINNIFDHLKSMMSRILPVFPRLDDLKIAFPHVYQKYVDKADGTVIIDFKPAHPDSDEWGFSITKVLAAYKPLKKEDNRIRFILDDVCNGVILVNELADPTDLVEYWISLQHSVVTKISKAEEGVEFKGWKGMKNYKLTKEDISTVIKNRVFVSELNI